MEPQKTIAPMDFYYWSTPNGAKIALMLEECKLPYRAIPIDISNGEQLSPEFMAISPNNKIPALVDHQAPGGPLSLFESGAILKYLAEKTGKFYPRDLHYRYEVEKWLMWQVSGLGPMAGQYFHFRFYAKEKIPYAIERYFNEVTRLFKVLDQQVKLNEYIASAYSIADIACWPWIAVYKKLDQTIEQFPHLQRWFELVGQRESVAKAYQATMQKTL